MEEIRFSDIKKMDYNDNLPFKFVLVDLLYKKQVDVNFVLSCYTEALDKERHLNAMRFNEACTNLTQILGGNFKGKKFITADFADELRKFLIEHGAHKGDDDVVQILYDLAEEFEA